MKSKKIKNFRDNGPTGFFDGVKKLFRGDYTKFDGTLAGDIVDSTFGRLPSIQERNNTMNNIEAGRPGDMDNPDNDTSWMNNPNDPRWDYYDDGVSSNGRGANNNYRGNQGMMRPEDELNSRYGGSYGPSARKKFIMHPDLKIKNKLPKRT